MKCKHCNGTGKVRGYFYEKTGVNKWERVWGDVKCEWCNGTGEVEQTAEEYIQTCNTEQLAEWLQEHMDCVSCGCKTLCCQGHDCKPALIKWLKQPHKESK